MKKIQTVKEALSLFEENAIIKGNTEETGEYKIGNKAYSVIEKCIDFLNKQNETELLFPFLSHDNPYVRLWAAYALHPLYPKESEKTLKYIKKKEKGIISFTAEMTLKEWKKEKFASLKRRLLSSGLYAYATKFCSGCKAYIGSWHKPKARDNQAKKAPFEK